MNMHLFQLAPGFMSPLRRRLCLALFCVVAVAASACASDSTDDAAAETTLPPPVSDAGDSDDDAGGVAGTATVEIAGSTYEFTGAETCEIGAPGTADAASNPEGRTANASFKDGDDVVALAVTEHTTSPSLTLDGESWQGAGVPPELDVTDDGAVWTGEMTSGSQEGVQAEGFGTGGLEAVTISVSCS